MTQPLQSQDGNDDLIKNIRDWQSQQQNIRSTDYVDKTLEYIEIPRLSASLLSLFKEVVLSLREQATIPNDVRISLERSCSALILWSDGYGIAQGHLNDIFQRSSKLRHTILKNLSRLGRVLTERTYLYMLLRTARSADEMANVPPVVCRIDTLSRNLLNGEAATVMFGR